MIFAAFQFKNLQIKDLMTELANYRLLRKHDVNKGAIYFKI